MNRKVSIRFKALILLFLLSFQTGAGFACAMEHIPALHAAKGKSTIHVLHHARQHHSTKNDCCKEASAHLVKADKLNTSPLTVPLLPVLLLLLPPVPGTIAFLDPGSVALRHYYALSDHHPPIPDIRITMQRFQI
jgi:hypothetical protein